MDVREKLVDLIIDAKRTDHETGSFTEYLADRLITNGVSACLTECIVFCMDCNAFFVLLTVRYTVGFAPAFANVTTIRLPTRRTVVPG